MSPKWSFNFLDSPPLSTESALIAKSSLSEVVPNPASQHQVSGIASPSGRTRVGQPAAMYGRLHLLGLPGEVRLAIWQAIHYDVLLGSEERWFQPPLTAWDALQLTCRQIHVEVADFWPSTILPQAKVDKAFGPVSSIQMLTHFRRLSLELPFSKGRNFYESLALSLCGLVGVLEDLRLFFIGNDKFNVRTFVHGCGLPGSGRRTSLGRLTIDGQYQRELQPIFTVLYFLQRLRTLVVKNANYPLLQSMIIKHKLHLEYLHISTDPRSILHTKHDLRGSQQLVVPPKENYPPLKVLHISANAAITALQVAAKASRTLQEVNWTLPDVSLQFYSWNWLEQTTVMLNHFGTYASHLRTLRICLHAQLYEAHYSEASLISGLKDHLPRLANLKILELHINSRADFSGAEIISAIPNSLTRLYVSDKLISPEKLEYLINKRYLWSDGQIGRGDPIESWPSETLVIDENTARPGASQNVASQDAGFIKPTVQKHGCAPEGRQRKRKGKRVCICKDEIIGEMRTRTDHVPYCPGKLGFIGYEYEGHDELCGCGKCDGTKLTMFRLNGRLLDRERNNHLACFDGGLQISPRSAEVTDMQNATEIEIVTLDHLDDEDVIKIQELWKVVSETIDKGRKEDMQDGERRKSGRQDTDGEVNRWLWREKVDLPKDEFTREEVDKLELQEFDLIMRDFDARKSGKRKSHHGYFGMEKEAVEHFERETTVQQWEIPERKWPDDATVGEKDHWMSES